MRLKMRNVGLTGDNTDMLKDQLVEIEKQIKTLDLEKRIILKQLEALELAEALENRRDVTFQKWKKNIAFMIEQNTID